MILFTWGVSRKNNPNDFGLPGGKVENNETLEEAACRETLEETGFQIFNLKKCFECLVSGEVDYWTTCFLVDQFEVISIPKEAGIVQWVNEQTLKLGCFGDFNTKLFNFLKTIK